MYVFKSEGDLHVVHTPERAAPPKATLVYTRGETPTFVCCVLLCCSKGGGGWGMGVRNFYSMSVSVSHIRTQKIWNLGLVCSTIGLFVGWSQSTILPVFFSSGTRVDVATLSREQIGLVPLILRHARWRCRERDVGPGLGAADAAHAATATGWSSRHNHNSRGGGCHFFFAQPGKMAASLVIFARDMSQGVLCL